MFDEAMFHYVFHYFQIYGNPAFQSHVVMNPINTFHDGLSMRHPQNMKKTKRLRIIYKIEHNLIDIPLDHYIKRNTRCSQICLKQLLPNHNKRTEIIYLQALYQVNHRTHSKLM